MGRSPDQPPIVSNDIGATRVWIADGQYIIYEVWRDIQALREHYEKPYVKQFVVDSAEYIEGTMEAQWIVMASQYVAGRPRETQK